MDLASEAAIPASAMATSSRANRRASLASEPLRLEGDPLGDLVPVAGVGEGAGPSDQNRAAAVWSAVRVVLSIRPSEATSASAWS